MNYMTVEDLTEPTRVLAKIRYNHKGEYGTLTKQPDGKVLCTFDAPVRAATPGRPWYFIRMSMYWAAEPLFCRKALKEEVSVSYGYKDLYSGKIGITIVTIVVLHFYHGRNINSGTDVHIIVESF